MRLAGFLLLCGLASAAHAVEPREMMSDPASEARARAISRELRCVVCQNESVDTSEAGLAHDMRVLIRQRIARGDSDDEIVAYLQSRYGDFVLMQPPLETKTILLWSAPGLALLIGGGIVAMSLRSPRRRRRGT